MSTVEILTTIREGDNRYRSKLDIGYQRTCSCKPSHINCMTPKQWLKDNFKSFFNHGEPDWDWIRDKIKPNE